MSTATMTPGYAKYLHALYAAPNLRNAFCEGYDHPGDSCEDWGYSTVSAEADAFRHGHKQRIEDGSNE